MQYNFPFWKVASLSQCTICCATCGMHVFIGFVENFFGHFSPTVSYRTLHFGLWDLHELLSIYSSSIPHRAFALKCRVLAGIWRNIQQWKPSPTIEIFQIGWSSRHSRLPHWRAQYNLAFYYLQGTPNGGRHYQRLGVYLQLTASWGWYAACGWPSDVTIFFLPGGHPLHPAATLYHRWHPRQSAGVRRYFDPHDILTPGSKYRNDILTPLTIFWPPYINQWQSFIFVLHLLDKIYHLISIILMNF